MKFVLLLVAVSTLMWVSASESVVQLQERSSPVRLGERANQRDDPFGGLLAIGTFTVSSAFLEELGEAGGEHQAAKAHANQLVGDNQNSDFVCPPGNNPDDWIVVHDVENSDAKVHCVAAPSGSDKNDHDVRFVASGAGTGVDGDGKYKYGQGNPKKEYSVFKGSNDLDMSGDVTEDSTISSLPCTTSAAGRPNGDHVGKLLHGEQDSDKKFMSFRSSFMAVDGTKTCTAVGTYLQTGELDLGVDGDNGDWSDKLFARLVKLTVCVSDTSDATFGTANVRKCADAKYVTSCMIGSSSNNAVDCNTRASDGSEGTTAEVALNLASMM